jgi:uncharacterized membrane protein YdjX (TVP38/TMEM64 family)
MMDGSDRHERLLQGPEVENKESQPSGSPSRAWIAGVVLIACVVTGIWLNRTIDVAAAIEVARAWKADSPLKAAVVACICLVLWIVAFMPTTLPELALGYVFGLRDGYIIDYVAKIIGSALCYARGRTALRHMLRSLLSDRELLNAFEHEVSIRPYWTAALLRAAWLPMAMKNYGMALIGVPWPAFFAVLIPIEAVDTYILPAIGSSAHEVSQLLNGDSVGDATWNQLYMVAAEVVLLIALCAHLGQLAMRAIERQRAGRSSGSASGLVLLL